MPLIRIRLEHGEESTLGDTDGADHLHPFLAFLLFFQKFSFPGNIAAVTFCRYILPESRDGRSGNDSPPITP